MVLNRFAPLVVEAVAEPLARRITETSPVPTIGIGASAACDGQVLVSYDMLGLTKGFEPKFLKRYGDLHATAVDATTRYIQEVRDGQFPDANHSHE